MAEKNQSQSQGGLLNAKKVAELLGIRPWMVYQLVKRGELPTVRIGSRIVRFRLESIEDWITEREAASLSRSPTACLNPGNDEPSDDRAGTRLHYL